MSEPPQRPLPPVWPSAQPLPQPQSQRQPQPWPPAWQQPGASIPPGSPAAPPVSAGVVQGLAYVGIGVWALVTRRTTRRAPIVSILVLTSIGLLLGLLDVVDSIANGRTPQLGSYVLVAFLFQRAIRVLRLMPLQNPYVVHRS
jgi:hypothetical protein